MPVYAITGANRGLGLEFVRQLSSSPSNTILAGVRSMSSDLQPLKSLDGQNIHIIECDTSSLASVSSFADECTSILSTNGQNKIDYILNNAGINSVPYVTTLTIPPDAFHEHMTINVLGPAKLVECLQHHLQEGSVIMNMTSGLGSLSKSRKMAKCPVYSISKAAVDMLTVQQAADLKDRGIICICMDPGWVKTRMGGDGATLEPQNSIGKMLETIHGLKKQDTAKFFTYTGEEVPW